VKDYVEIARTRAIQGSRCCLSDIDLTLELLADIPKDGQIVKIGANCPLALVWVGLRPDIHFLSIDDGDYAMCMEEAGINDYHAIDKDLDPSRYKCVYPRHGVTEAQNYKGQPIDMLFLNFPLFLGTYTLPMMVERMNAWMVHLNKPAWLVLDRNFKDSQVAKLGETLGAPDKESGWEAAWRFK
jgi:hypothetical protein